MVGASVGTGDAMVVFLEPGSSRRELDAVATAIGDVVGPGRSFVVDAEAALVAFEYLYEDSDVPAVVTADDLPASVRVFDPGPEEVEAIEAALDGLPSIREVLTPGTTTGCDLDDPAVRDAVRRSMEARFGGAELIVFLEPGADAADDEVIRRTLLEHPEVVGVRHLDTDDAMAEFECLFADRSDMVGTVDPSDLPTSYRVDVGDIAPESAEGHPVVEDVAAAVRGLPAVREVVHPSDLRGASSVPAPGPRVCRVEGDALR